MANEPSVESGKWQAKVYVKRTLSTATSFVFIYGPVPRNPNAFDVNVVMQFWSDDCIIVNVWNSLPAALDFNSLEENCQVRRPVCIFLV